MRFEWDEQKNASNLRKHGITFDVASAVFDDPLHIIEPDRIVDHEQLWKAIGEVNGKYLLVVAHTVVSEELEAVRIISAREADARKGKSMKVIYEREPGTPLTPKQLKQLEDLKGRPIDYSDIPASPPGAWKNAVRGKFYRPIKKAVSLRLDEDVIAWLKKDGDGYQTRANRMLRERMLNDLRMKKAG